MVATNSRFRRGIGGFSAVEILVVMVLLLTVSLFVGSLTVRLYRRYQMFSAVKEVQALVLATRMLAVRQNQNAILFTDLPNHRIYSWVDKNRNFKQDADEPTVNVFVVPPIVDFSMPPNGQIDGKDSVSFDKYLGNPQLFDMIVFQPDGTIVPPEDQNSNAPRRPDAYTADIPFGSIDCRGTNIPSTGLPPLHGQWNANNGMGCRGIYMAKRIPTGTAPSEDVFRISVDDLGRTGRVTLLKWIGSNERAGLFFVPANPGWHWVD